MAAVAPPPRLQALGGPVLLSQIGTVGAGVGVAVGAGLLGERYPPLVWAGVGMIALGIGLTVWAQRCIGCMLYKQ